VQLTGLIDAQIQVLYSLCWAWGGQVDEHAPAAQLNIAVSRAKREEELAQRQKPFEIKARSRGERRQWQAGGASGLAGASLRDQAGGAANNSWS